MTTIGICDSGVGGLTTLNILRRHFPFADFYYLADNKNMPYGTKSPEELSDVFSRLLKKLKAHSEIQVIACNTASSYTEDSDVIKLLPPIVKGGKTLYLATPLTTNKLVERLHIESPSICTPFDGNDNGCDAIFADTSELATLVEVYTAVGARKNCLNMRELLPYLASKLFKFKGVNNVVLGCSHYLYLKNEISKILGSVNFFDGNGEIVNTLNELLVKEKGAGKVVFDFTADDESRKYSSILALLEREGSI